VANSEKASDLFDHLRVEISKLDYSDRNRERIQELQKRTRALILNTFGSASPYTADIDNIRPAPSHAGLNNRPIYFEKGKQALLNLIDIMIDDLRLSGDTSPLPGIFDMKSSSKAQKHQNVSDNADMMLVNPLWKDRNFSVENDLCFLLMPFTEAWSDDVWNIIDSIVTTTGMRCERADQKDGRVIMEDIWAGICRAQVVIADLTAKNPNVTYEVGLADVLGKNVLLLSQTPNDVPFDFKGARLIVYENSFGGVKKLTKALEERLKKLIQTPGLA
jgi:hypothetical protein